jgi:CBS domain-containing protein
LTSQIFYTKFVSKKKGPALVKLTVAEIARKDLVLCRASDSLLLVANLMLDRKVGSVLVESAHDVVGIVTKNDLLRTCLSGRTWNKTTVDAVMSHPVATCNADDTIDEALHKFENTRYSRLAVKDKTGKIIGVAKMKILERFQLMSANYDMVRRRREASIWKRMDRRLRKSRIRASEAAGK